MANHVTKTAMMSSPKLRLFTNSNIQTHEKFQLLSQNQREALRVVAHVLPFRVNNYVLDHLIDWSNVPDDPIYQLTFMQKGMLDENQYEKVKRALHHPHSTKEDIQTAVSEVRADLNPHPAGQLSSNVPKLNDEPVPGVQHKYRETALVFPAAGQQCHSYCTFCFRWPQFIGDQDLKFASDPDFTYLNYLKENSVITDVLFTGGDPMVMSAKLLKKHIEPLLSDEYKHIQNIRIGSKSLSYWPYRYVTDGDHEEIFDLFKRVNDSGKKMSFMAHINHLNEMENEVFEEAIFNIRKTGTVIRTQAPLLRHINDDWRMWVKMWKRQVQLGMVPYYMFMERDTGPKKYFSIPIFRALQIYRNAIQNVSGLARTARGPSMSTHPGKVCVEGIAEINGEKVFVLNLLQARNPDFVKRPFFAKYDESAEWLTDLKPAFGEKRFFFE